MPRTHRIVQSLSFLTHSLGNRDRGRGAERETGRAVYSDLFIFIKQHCQKSILRQNRTCRVLNFTSMDIKRISRGFKKEKEGKKKEWKESTQKRKEKEKSHIRAVQTQRSGQNRKSKTSRDSVVFCCCCSQYEYIYRSRSSITFS